MFPYLLFLFMSTANSSNMTGFIVGGFLTDIHQWPFIAFISAEGVMSDGNEVTSSCGGSLLSSQTVLSAAHCFDDLTDKHERFKNFVFTVYMGHSSFEKAKMVRAVMDYVGHQKYKPNCDRVIHDIAIAFLQEPVRFSATVQKVILVPKNTDVERGELREVMVAGWGMATKALTSLILNLPAFPRGDFLLNSEKKSEIQSTTDTKQSHGSTKLKAAFQILDTARSCQQIIRYDAPGVICASPANQFAYRGDSGGPLIRKSDKLQVGITSYRLRKAGVTIYSSVPYYYSWIQKTQEELFAEFCPEHHTTVLQKKKIGRHKNNKPGN